MPVLRDKFPLRVCQAGTDLVHAARSKPDGYDTPCWLWLKRDNPHIWCAEDSGVTCPKCIERLGPPSMNWTSARIPKTGTLHERLAKAVEDEIRQDADVAWRITETVEVWQQQVEKRIRLAVNGALVDLVPDSERASVAHNLTDQVMRAMGVSDSTTSQGPELAD